MMTKTIIYKTEQQMYSPMMEIYGEHAASEMFYKTVQCSVGPFTPNTMQ